METRITSHQVTYGERIIPIKRIGLFSADDWEAFVEEWLDLKKQKYNQVERFGGAGDKGRDVVAYVDDNRKGNYIWDCYQCKQYSQALMPVKVFVEFGKILHYTFLKEYPVPRKYFFVAPKGCGTSLSKLLQNAELLKQELIKNWDKYCRKDIINPGEIKLEGEFLEFVKNFDFSIFGKIAPKIIIEEHSKHPNHLTRFGGGLPPREKLDETSIPSAIQANESIYVTQLLLAYGSDASTVFEKAEALTPNSVHHKHFNRARISFHHAEQLRNFSRDNLPKGVFEEFQEEIKDGIMNIVDENMANGFQKCQAVEDQSVVIQISSNPLKDVSSIKDRHGVCHQLSNESIIKWI